MATVSKRIRLSDGVIETTGEFITAMKTCNLLTARTLICTDKIDYQHVVKKLPFAVHIACKHNDAVLALLLINLNLFDLEEPDDENWTPLAYSVYNGMSEVALALIKTGKSNPNHVCYHGHNALTLATLKKHEEVALALIKTGESNPGQITDSGNTALLFASVHGSEKVALELLKTGKAKPHHQCNAGETALVSAIVNNMHAVVEELTRY